MARYWWVNHSQSARRMIDGGYLWSPKNKVTKDGKPINNETYNNMRRVSPDDLIISFADLKISFVGRASGYAFTSRRPRALAINSATWGEYGWILPVSWTRVSKPFLPREHIDLIRLLLPERHSPIKANGDGNQNAFLTEISAELFELLCGLAAFDPSIAGYNAAAVLTPEAVDDEVAQRIVEASTDYTTETEAIVTARRGQGKFRQNVRQQEETCRLTGITNPQLLIASHIKPWRDCEANERLDGANGLMLTPSADRLFDRGFITFHDEGEIEVSSRLPADDLGRLGFGEIETSSRRVLQIAKPKAFTPPQRLYLEYHRKQVFLPAV